MVEGGVTNFRDNLADGPHPLDEVQVLIAGSAEPGFVTRMKERGIVAVATAETDPCTAVAAYLAGTLKPAAPHDDDCGCH
jgi:hypothetical protein